MGFDRSASGRRVAVVVTVLLCLPLAGCLAIGPLTGRATDEWTRSYPLAAGGEVRVVNINGKVDIQGTDGATVEVRADRTARAATEQGARELLPRISIREDIRSDRVSLETERIPGFMIGASWEVQYHLKVPKGAAVSASTTNGGITLTALTGTVNARTTNGGVTAKELSGGVQARTTNGPVNVELLKVGAGKITLGTTNGGVSLALPEAARADLSARVTNGGISVTGLDLDVSEHSRRLLEGRMNGGGTPIELRTTNGGIRIRATEAQR
jgi:hypothetical protein